MATMGGVWWAGEPISRTKPAAAGTASREPGCRLWKSGLFGFLLAGMAILAPQISAAAESDTAKLFQTLDTNGDKQIDRGEFNIQAMEIFYNIDKNKDGFLSLDEVLMSEASFAGLDRQGKGKVSGFTFIDSEIMDFDKIDSDGDGFITFEELEALVTTIRRPN